MKKIIALFVFMFAFNANAQDVTQAEELATKDVYAISQFLKLNETALTDLQSVFKEKHLAISQEGISEERKVVMSRFVETKFKSILTTEQFDALKGNNELYEKLTKN